MYRENSVNTLVCQKRANTTMGHKMLLQENLKVLKEWRKLLSRGKIKDNLVAYYTDTDKSQLNRNIQSSSVVDLRTEPSKRSKMSIWTSQSYKRKRTQGLNYTCLSCCKMSQYRFSFSYCNFLIIDKKKRRYK